MRDTILCGDVLYMLATIPDEYVDMCVTSPPYWGLRDYGVDGQIGLEPTLDEWVSKMVAVFREVRRVLKPCGTLWLNLGDSFTDKQLTGQPWRVAFALQADGWYLRSDIIWHKPNPMPESVTDRPTKSHEYLFLMTKQPRYYYDADAVREPRIWSLVLSIVFRLSSRTMNRNMRFSRWAVSLGRKTQRQLSSYPCQLRALSQVKACIQ